MITIPAKEVTEEFDLLTFCSWNIPKPRRVLYLNLEIKQANLHRRVYNMCKELGITGNMIQHRLKIYNLRGTTISPEQIIVLVEHHKAEVVIIDPLYKLLEGDENAASDMKPTLAAFDRIAEATGAALILIHHNAKGRAGDRDVRDRGAGSGVLARDYDAALYLTDHILGSSHYVLASIARNYPPTEPVTVLFEDGRFVKTNTAPIELTTRTATRLSNQVTIEPSQVLTYLEQKGAQSKTALIQGIRDMGASRDQAKDIVANMVSSGTLETYREKKAGGITFHGTAKQILKLGKKDDRRK